MVRVATAPSDRGDEFLVAQCAKNESCCITLASRESLLVLVRGNAKYNNKTMAGPTTIKER